MREKNPSEPEYNNGYIAIQLIKLKTLPVLSFHKDRIRIGAAAIGHMNIPAYILSIVKLLFKLNLEPMLANLEREVYTWKKLSLESCLI